MAADDDSIIKDRKINFCPSTSKLPADCLVAHCEKCEQFFFHCCGCWWRAEEAGKGHEYPCHNYRLAFVDGACLNNGKADAKAGIGVAFGSDRASQISLPVAGSVDKFPLRSSQRAELLAAKVAIKGFAFAATAAHEEDEKLWKVWVVASDSEYVVKGMTEWLPAWKARGWKTSSGTTPKNLDLFRALDAEVTKYENQGVKIAFWHIPRELNDEADGLAKAAAVDGDVARA